MKTRHVKKHVKKTRRVKSPTYPETDPVTDAVMEFEYDTDCDVFTIYSEKEKKQQWNKAITKFRKNIDEYVSKRKKSCKL